MGGRRRHHDPVLTFLRSEPGPPDGHTHCCCMDEDCNGVSGPAPDGHCHVITGSDLEVVDGHTHEISAERCSGGHKDGEPCR